MRVPSRRRARKRLKDLSIALGMARLQVRTGHMQAAQVTLARLHEDIQVLRRTLERGRRKKAPPSKRPALACCLS
jgi:hypothetical protein